MKKRRLFYSLSVILLLITVVVGWFATGYLGDKARQVIIREGESVLFPVSIHLSSTFDNLEGAVKALAGSPFIPPALLFRGQKNLSQANSTLDRYNSAMSASVSYLMDADGVTVASSNRSDPDSFIGISYRFRPYFQEALRGHPVRYFGMGITSGKRGFYTSHPVRDFQGKVIGVVAMKKDLDEIETSLSKHAFCFLIDSHGIIFLSNRPAMVFKTLWPLDKVTRETLAASRQYGNSSFESVFEKGIAHGTEIHMDGQGYFVSRKVIDRDGWSIVVMTPTERIWIYKVTGILTTIFLCLLILIFTLIIYLIDRSQRAIRESEALYRTLAENSIAGVYLVQEGRFRFINTYAASYAGYTREELLGKNADGIVHHEDREIVKGNAKKMLLGHRKAPYEFRVITKEGETRWIMETVTSIMYEGRSAILGNSMDVTEQRFAEEAMRDQHWRLENIIEGTHVGTWEWNVQTGETVFNEMWAQIIGYTLDELAPINIKTWETFAHPDDLKQSAELLERHFAGELPYYNCECRMKHKDGHWVWVHDCGRVITRTADGKPLMMFGTHSDITDRKQAEEALQSNEARLRAVFDSVQDFIFIKDTNRRYLTVNNFFQRRFQIDPSVFLGHTDEEIPIFENKDLIGAIIQDTDALVLGGETAHYELTHRICGTPITFDILQTPLRDGQGNVTGICGLSRDTTIRKQTEEKLHEITRRLHLATASAKAGVWDWNLQTNEMIWDDRMLELYGLTRKNFPGGIEAWEQGLHPDDFSRAMEECQAALRGERDFDPEFRVLRPDGTVVHIKANGLVLRDEDGKPLSMTGLNTDITAQKNTEEDKRSLEERLNRSEKMEALGTLAGGVAHDLNNVLGIVVGYAEMILDDVDKTDPLRPDLVKIMEGGERAAAIVQDLLTLARRGVTGRSILNLNKIIADCQKSPEFVNLSAYHSSVKIKTDLEPDLLNITGSSVHLGKTLFNLISNASEAMAKGGVVTIKTTSQYLDKPIQGYDQIREGDYVVLSVSDTGEGINATDLKRIFEPFYTKKVMGRSGTGLGLAVVWGTVKDHHGYINVQSEEGKGSTFTLYFPVTREDITAAAVAISISEYMGKGESILVVDDVKEQRDLASTMLRKLNYNVTNVSSGEEAITYLKEHRVDLMVLDMIMDPGMDGLDTYKSVLKIHPQQKAIIVSGFSESDRVIDAQFLGAGAYVKKPYVIEKLGMAVKKELADM